MKRILFILISVITLLFTGLKSSANEEFTEIRRISGDNRYLTSVEFSRKNFSSSEFAVITSGQDFPDAISSGALAQILKAPILLVENNNISNEVREEIGRLGADKVYIVGGESKIKESLIKTLNIDYEILAGKDRYETSEKVLEKYEEISGVEEENIIIAGGNNYPDALSASYLAKELKKPILLVNGENNYLNRAKYAVGSLKSLNLKEFNGELIYGPDRYATSLAVMKYLGKENNEILISSGIEYADALVASSIGKPILLSDKEGFSREIIEYIGSLSPNNIIFMGGEKLLPKYLEDQIIGSIDYNFENAVLPEPMKSNTSGKVMIFTYHDVGDKEHRYQRTPEGFKYDILNLYKKGYLPVSLKDYMRGEINIPSGYTPYVITFDDGNKNKFNILDNGEIDPNSSYAILKELEGKLEFFNPYATFFVSGEIPFGQKEYIEYKFKLMIESGMDIGNHTKNHANLKENPRKIEEEIAIQKSNLEKYLPEDYEVNTFAIPFSSVFSGREYKRLISGTFNGIKYNNIAIGIGGWAPDYYPNKSNYNLVSRIPGTRIGVDGYGMYDFIDYFDKNPNERYVK
ncbi:cell wall-binding repeat-containing protein [Miniphocaeibacter halophilus]|uniref:Cell wall-binding repeat-containing protein n=1 Tax=Miniphocaeibacter halophilus TaxID=2931922 RepID=A0AC61MT23_9FIRM|nr:cell wall-binding repeat-containing protein [Miniphocaeibacter halophilus]QQK08830.1 cell wall-binding repeat-containing protein [Miniphocaeibacter halophilus]